LEGRDIPRQTHHHHGRPNAGTRPRNDPRQYDDLAGQWWNPSGALATLHWLAAARAQLVPPPPRPGALLLDIACGGGLLAPYIADTGYRHLGFDLSPSAVRIARHHGLAATRAEATALPVRSETADVVVAGEILEHVPNPARVIGECARALRPGGTLILDTIANTALARLLVVTLGENIPGLLPKHIHDPALFVDRSALRRSCADVGIDIQLRGLRPDYSVLAWLARRRGHVRLLPTRSTAVIVQGTGTKHPAPNSAQPTEEAHHTEQPDPA
jgi:2-polyprenyl-6-hydroxyphenyl methylase/3-demethylubiquinone-9 3-methyltransferase